MYHEAVGKMGLDPKDVMQMIYTKGRDNARTPFQWNAQAQAGFTTGIPWIKVNPNYPTINANQALVDPNSILRYYQKLIQLRGANPVIVYGSYDLIPEAQDPIFAFTRTLESERLVVILNFSIERQVFGLPDRISAVRGELLISNYEVDPGEDFRQIPLRPYEAQSLPSLLERK